MTVFLRRMAALAFSAGAMTLVAGGLTLAAQQQGQSTQADAKTKAKVAKRAFDPTRRVPNYFGQLGLTDAQRESIYKIQARHMPKIEELEQQIEGLRTKMIHECESVLTPSQKQMLAERRSSAAESRTKKAAAPAKQ